MWNNLEIRKANTYARNSSKKCTLRNTQNTDLAVQHTALELLTEL